jgi:predicted  nucleic acid-binding Zn-ribbon protein
VPDGGLVSNYDAEADALADRIATLEHELAKADRRTAEQERVIASQHELIVKLREALDEALARWEVHDERYGRMHRDCIARLRKFTEAP